MRTIGHSYGLTEPKQKNENCEYPVACQKWTRLLRVAGLSCKCHTSPTPVEFIATAMIEERAA